MALNIVLFEPEIPQNTGNISRTCAVTATRLHIIKPMGFSLDEKHVKRAGLDYWQYLDLTVYENIYELWERFPAGEFHYFSAKAEKRFDTAVFNDECFLVFGRETAGLPKSIMDNNEEHLVRIPMHDDRRCLNLSNAVCAGLYEALRQNGYLGMN